MKQTSMTLQADRMMMFIIVLENLFMGKYNCFINKPTSHTPLYGGLLLLHLTRQKRNVCTPCTHHMN